MLICATEGETKSQLVTAFENCRIGIPNNMPDQIARYLKQKFTVDEGVTNAVGKIEPERSFFYICTYSKYM